MYCVRDNKFRSDFLAGLLLAATVLTGCGRTELTGESPDANTEGKTGSVALAPATETTKGEPDLSQTETVSFQSGMEVGAIPMPFEVEDVTGPNKGDTLCYRCLYGERPVVGIFVRELDPGVETLIQKIDQEVATHQDAKLAAFVVLLTEEPAAEKAKLKKIASEKQIQHVPLTLFAGKESPLGYNVKQDAAVNVMLWEGVVKANRAFRSSELDDAGIQEVVEDTRLMVH